MNGNQPKPWNRTGRDEKPCPAICRKAINHRGKGKVIFMANYMDGQNPLLYVEPVKPGTKAMLPKGVWQLAFGFEKKEVKTPYRMAEPIEDVVDLTDEANAEAKMLKQEHARLVRRQYCLEDRLERMEFLGTDHNTKAYRGCLYDIDWTKRKIIDVESALDECKCRSWAIGG